jgi:xanthine dehydrogenase accessory factor
MRDLLQELQAFETAGDTVGRGVVTSVWGSAPRPEGACLLATRGGKVVGSVSGGCVEGATAEEIRAAMDGGGQKLVTFGVTDETAWSVGLACGGTIKVLVQPAVPARALAAARGVASAVVATVITAVDGRLIGASATVGEDGAVDTDAGAEWLGAAMREPALAALKREASTTVEATAPDGSTVGVFLEAFPRRPTLVIFGAVHIAVAMVPMARSLGFYTVVADGRATFLARERFPEADELILGWPDEAFRQVEITPATHICVLSHDPKFDEPALRIALRSPAAYIGAIGSRKTQEARRARLLAEGFSAADLKRLHGPIGLDLGGRSAAETALAILAEITMRRYGGRGVR